MGERVGDSCRGVEIRTKLGLGSVAALAAVGVGFTLLSW